MDTLQEYLIYTKGWEYIIAVLFVCAFLAFWQSLGGER